MCCLLLHTVTLTISTNKDARVCAWLEDNNQSEQVKTHAHRHTEDHQEHCSHTQHAVHTAIPTKTESTRHQVQKGGARSRSHTPQETPQQVVGDVLARAAAAHLTTAPACQAAVEPFNKTLLQSAAIACQPVQQLPLCTHNPWGCTPRRTNQSAAVAARQQCCKPLHHQQLRPFCCCYCCCFCCCWPPSLPAPGCPA